MRFTIAVFAALLWGCAPDPGEPAAPPPPPAAESAAAASDAPMITDAWVRPVPPGARMTAGYLRVRNPGPEVLVIVGAQSPQFGSIEMHGTVLEDGMARMRHQETITVAPGETVRFEPGGLHLMLMQPAAEIPSSGDIELSLLFENGERLEFAAPVGQPGG